MSTRSEHCQRRRLWPSSDQKLWDHMRSLSMDIDIHNIEDEEDDFNRILEISRVEFDALNLPRHAPVAAPMRQAPNSIDDLASAHLANVLSIVIDAQPAYIRKLIEQQLRQEDPGDVLGVVINYLIDKPDYPRVEVRGGKRKHSGGDPVAGPSGNGNQEYEEAKKQKIDWASLERAPPSDNYRCLAKRQLELDFEYVSKTYIRRAFATHNHLYYPTYFYIKGKIEKPDFKALKKAPTTPSKGKEKVISCAVFDAERKAVTDTLQEGINLVRSSTMITDELIPGIVECQCCFEEYAFVDLVKCPEAHLFCKKCAQMNAEQAIGQRNASVKCMDQGGCRLEFADKVLRSFLSDKALALVDRIRTEKAVLDAGLEGLKDCPFCEFKCIIENDQERLFRCRSDQCGKITCLQCRMENHLPKTCEEVMQDRRLDGCHVIEEAMTMALMRKCPACQRAFVKSEGCNKMKCPNCKTYFCYICRRVVNGYVHFDRDPGRAQKPVVGVCPLFDDDLELDQRHYDEVIAAARAAAAKQKEENPDIDAATFAVDLPAAPLPGLTQHRGHRERPMYRYDEDDDFIVDFRDPLWELHLRRHLQQQRRRRRR